MFSFLSSFYYAIFGGFRIDETTTLGIFSKYLTNCLSV